MHAGRQDYMSRYRPVSVCSRLGEDLRTAFVSDYGRPKPRRFASLVSINNPKQVNRISVFDLLLTYSDFSARFLRFLVHVDRSKVVSPASFIQICFRPVRSALTWTLQPCSSIWKRLFGATSVLGKPQIQVHRHEARLLQSGLMSLLE